MNPLHVLYLESIFDISIGPLNHGAAEYEGVLSSEDVSRLCDQGAVFRQNYAVPQNDIDYVCVYVEDGKIDIAIDPSTNTIQVHFEVKGAA